tara:strand:+ start:1229 stop:1675 length:447 start_codon:yes stop_codon:yes gene_type:complete
MDTLQELIFENKDKIPDGLYLQLQNELKKQHEKKSGLYEITYITGDMRLEEGQDRYYSHRNELRLNVKTAVIKLGDDEFYNYKKIKEQIEANGWIKPTRGFEDLTKNYLQVYYLDEEYEGEDGGGLKYVALRTFNVTNDMIIISIKEV